MLCRNIFFNSVLIAARYQSTLKMIKQDTSGKIVGIRAWRSIFLLVLLTCQNTVISCSIHSQKMLEDFVGPTANAVCRKSCVYPVKRAIVPDDKVSWSVSWMEYSPPSYSDAHLSTAAWADPDIKNENFKPKWNAQDGDIDRQSYNQNGVVKYEIDGDYPRNPAGRSGLSGRGKLGRWGPNHAGDAIITRWKRAKISGEKLLNSKTGQPILQFIAILRKDCNKWAIPGGFVDPKETSSDAVLRELFEEAINADKLTAETQVAFKNFLKDGKMVYRGYVDDPRNTDNAWIETTAVNFHDESGAQTLDVSLDARDDAADATWLDIEPDMDIYPPHYALVDHLVRANPTLGGENA